MPDDEQPSTPPASSGTEPPAAATPKPARKRPAKKEADSASAPTAGAAPAATEGSTPAESKAAAPEAKRPAKAAPHRPAASKPAAPAILKKKVRPVPSGTVVDASGLVLGRAASLLAKRLLNGEKIVVVNAEQAVVTGDRAMVLETYRANRARGSKRTGPHFPRYPDRIFRRTVRGMVPHLKTRGQEALDRLQVFIGVPPELKGHATQTLEGAKIRPALRRPLTLAEISRLLGARV